MIVRTLRREDVDAAIAMGRDLHRDSPTFGRHRFDAEKLRKLAERCLEHPDWCCLMAWVGEEPVGLFVGFVAEDWFGPDIYAADLTFWVRPASRGSSAAVRLLFAFEGWAEARGAKEIRVGVSTGISVDKAANFYMKAGYALRGPLLAKPA